MVLGIFAGNAADTIIWRATLVMIACWPAGYGVGVVAQRAVNRNIEAYKAAHPLPPDPTALSATPLEPGADDRDDEPEYDQDHSANGARGHEKVTETVDDRDAEVAVTTSADV